MSPLLPVAPPTTSSSRPVHTWIPPKRGARPDGGNADHVPGRAGGATVARLGVRATADVLATEDVGGVPGGVGLGMLLKDQFGHLARSAVRHLMP